MCGICGFVGFSDKSALRRMMEKLKPRGPDGEGTFVDGEVSLGNTRLAVIDLSKKAKQPMTNEDKSVWITFNGEIYNFQKLREELEQKGHRFRSESDTECIVHAYDEYGTDCVKRLRGMFAFAIWDLNEKQLFLANDRLGKKPLYFWTGNGKFVFASEMKAMLASRHAPRELNLQSVCDFLSYGAMAAPATIVKGIYRAEPASCLLFKDGALRKWNYWDLEFVPKERSEAEVCKKLMQQLQEAVELRLVADVPLGIFLSGGIDSSAVTAVAAGLVEGELNTFSLAYGEEYSELEYAEQVAEMFGTSHKSYEPKFEIEKFLPKFVEVMNEPHANDSHIGYLLLAEKAKKDVTVLLGGDGGDENFCGYPRYVTNNYVPNFENAMIGGTFVESERRRLLKGCIGKIDFRFMKLYNLLKEAKTNHWVDNVSYANFRATLADDYIFGTDLATMSNAVELRSPMLDHLFVEFCGRIPARMKVFGLPEGIAGKMAENFRTYRLMLWHAKKLQLKHILKRAFLNVLPREILHREKQGFGSLLNSWIKGRAGELAESLLFGNDARCKEIIDLEYAQKYFANRKSADSTGAKKMWLLLMLELWMRRFDVANGEINYR